MKKSTMLQTIKNYKWRSFFLSYWLLIFVAMMLPIIVLFVVMSNHYNTLLSNSFRDYSTNKLYSIQQEFDLTFSSIVKNYNDISVSNKISSYITNPNSNINTKINYSKELYSYIKNCTDTNDLIDCVYFYDRNNQYVFSTSEKISSGYYTEFSDKSWNNTNSQFISGKSNDLIFKQNINYGYNSLPCTIVYKISTTEISKILKDDKEYNFYIVEDASEKTIFANSNNKDIKIQFTKHIRNKNNNIMISVDKNNLIASIKLKNYPLTLILAGTPSYYRSQSAYNSLTLWSLITVALLLALIVSFLISTKFYSTIYNIILLLQNPFNNYDELKNKKKYNELVYISNNIISIINKSQKIEKELTERLVMLNEAQSTALESQLNPHFLFNTLQLINLIEMSRSHGETDITRAVSLLSDLLRYALDTTEHLVPLETEISYNKKYMQIQNIKFGDDFTTIWNVTPEAMQCKILKLSIQPVLENAISHGIASLKGIKGYIVVSAFVKNERLIVTVKDNGVGIPREKLNEINNQMQTLNLYKKHSIGLSNINQRIQLIFGKDYRVTLDSSKNGTTVKFVLPIIKD